MSGFVTTVDLLPLQFVSSEQLVVSKQAISNFCPLCSCGVLYQIGHTQGIIKIGQSLLMEHYANDLEDVDMQKYIADILLESMGNKQYVDFCVELFKNHKIEGMLYTLVNAYQATEQYDMALKELDTWISNNPSNQRMLNKRSKVLEKMSIQ